jgi:tetratricopeptide (TPR) repeat protein
LGQLQEVNGLFNGAKQIDPKDPELNLIQGFMDLLVATKLPLANANDAIDRLQKNARPSFMADWGIAIGKRDQKKYDEALVSVDRAIAAAPTQPELHYLKGQILYLKGKEKSKDKKDVAIFRQAQPEFRQALSKSPQLAKKAVAQLFIEACQNQEKVDGIDRPCRELAKPIRQVNGRWGPLAKDLPQLEAVQPVKPSSPPTSPATNPMPKPSSTAKPSAAPTPTVSPMAKPSATPTPTVSPTVTPSPMVSPKPVPTLVPLPKPVMPR